MLASRRFWELFSKMSKNTVSRGIRLNLNIVVPKGKRIVTDMKYVVNEPAGQGEPLFLCGESGVDQGDVGHFDGESGPLSGDALHGEGSAVVFDSMAGNRKTEAGASHFARSALINPVETLEDSRL